MIEVGLFQYSRRQTKNYNNKIGEAFKIRHTVMRYSAMLNEINLHRHVSSQLDAFL